MKKSMNEKTIIILATLDTKWKEAGYLRDIIVSKGYRGLLMDVSMGWESPVPADISSSEIAVSGGSDIEKVRELAPRNRGEASEIMAKGAICKVKELFEKSKMDGIISFGGASNATLASKVMKSLPFGVPKFIATSVASVPAYAGKFIGTSDITMMHSVVDIAGENKLVLDVLERSAGTICGMVEISGRALRKEAGKKEKPLIAVTEFGFSDKAGKLAVKYLEERGFEPIAIHAQGIGDMAMEELIGQGFFDGIIDLVPAGVGEELLGGNRAAGPARLEAAGKMGIPQVIAPCGFEMLSCGPLSRRDTGSDVLWTTRNLSSRKLYIPDEFRVQASTTNEELQEIARVVAEKLNQAQGPVQFLIPLKGWSSLSIEGAPLYGPDMNEAFYAELRKNLKAEIEIKKLDFELNSEEFVMACVDDLLKMRGMIN